MQRQPLLHTTYDVHRVHRSDPPLSGLSSIERGGAGVASEVRYMSGEDSGEMMEVVEDSRH